MLLETKRFFGLEEPPLPNFAKTQGRLAIASIENYASHVGDNKNGIQATFQLIEITKEFFKHTYKRVSLTKPPFFSLVDEHIEFGRRLPTYDQRHIEPRPALWFVHGRTAEEITRQSLFSLTSGSAEKTLHLLENQSTMQIASKFIATIESAIK